MKILINTPLITIPAGVSNHYLGLKPYFSKDVIYNQYLTNKYIKKHIRLALFHKPIRILLFLFDILKFILLIIFSNCKLILLNPSFDFRALKRDEIFLKITILFKRKVVVFIHGWDLNYLDKVFSGVKKFSPVWKKANAFFVLADEFKENLEKLGITVPIHLTTTKVNDRLLDNIPSKKNIIQIQNILFLARIEKAKGIFTAIDAFTLLQKKYNDLIFRVVGSGGMLEDAKEYVKLNNITNVVFTGALFGDDLKAEYKNAHVYILPTHGEGMPTSVLEAMAFGLPVITRPVGGIKDFFENGKMGFLIDSLDPVDYALCIKNLINNIQKANKISEFNKNFALTHFMASKVAFHLEKMLQSI